MSRLIEQEDREEGDYAYDIESIKGNISPTRDQKIENGWKQNEGTGSSEPGLRGRKA